MKGFQNYNCVLGTGFTGTNKVALPRLSLKQKDLESRKQAQMAQNKSQGTSSDTVQSEFTCSISNRQFRAKIGINSHQRTHNHTQTLNIQDLRWSFSILKDEQKQNKTKTHERTLVPSFYYNHFVSLNLNLGDSTLSPYIFTY